jgi:2,4-dienoyl-CoA reductase-like NADH-dependent reductase (Old Yellow Enzyme family)
VYQAIRERVGPDYPVILKMNGSDDLPFRRGLKTQDLVHVAQRMEGEGVDAVEISAGHYESAFTFERGMWKGFFSALTRIGVGTNLPWCRRIPIRLLAPVLDWGLGRIAGYSEGFNLPYARLFKQALRIPVISVGGFLHREVMEDAIAGGGCDMVSVARALIADPFLYRHMKEGVQGPQCDFCNACFARGATWPVDCYNDKVRSQKDQMLRAELG